MPRFTKYCLDSGNSELRYGYSVMGLEFPAKWELKTSRSSPRSGRIFEETSSCSRRDEGLETFIPINFKELEMRNLNLFFALKKLCVLCVEKIHRSIAPRERRGANTSFARRGFVWSLSPSSACVARFAWGYGRNAPPELWAFRDL